MKGEAGLSDIEHRLAELSAEGDPLETLSATVDFEIFRAVLAKAVRQRDTDAEKEAIKAGSSARIWPDKPSKAAQKDVDARWKVKFAKAKPAADGTRLREGLIDPNNTASEVWADTAYRSEANEDFLRGRNRQGQPHSPQEAARHADAVPDGCRQRQEPAVRAHVEHPFAVLKRPMRLGVRTIGKARAEAAITLAAMAYNMKRWDWLDRKENQARLKSEGRKSGHGGALTGKAHGKNHSLAIHSDASHTANLMPSEIAVSGGAQLF